jgi:arylformamidase
MNDEEGILKFMCGAFTMEHKRSFMLYLTQVSLLRRPAAPLLHRLYGRETMPTTPPPAPQLDAQDDPDSQRPMPFAAAAEYAKLVMRWAREADFSGLKVQRDVAYGTHRLQRYDVFAPPSAQAAPILIFWHGGGWTNGYRQYVHFMAQHVCALGMCLVAPSYRLVPEHKLPAAYEDALACLAHVHAHAPSVGGDAQRIVLSGHSAGGHLAALLALRRQSAVHQSIRACLPISAIMDLHHPSPESGSLEERVYELVLNDPLDDALMSPICWAAGNRVPFALSIGSQDSARVRISNRRLAVLLKAQPAACQLHEQEGQSHFDTHTSLVHASHPWYALLSEHALLP